MECLADGRSEPCLEVRKRKADGKKSDEKRRPLTKVVAEKKDKRQKSDGESRSWVGTTSHRFPGTSSSSLSSSSSSSAATCNVYEVSSPLYFEGYGHVVGGMTAFFDEEEVFNMHGLLDGMAEGLMASPLGCGLDWGGVEYVDLTLWSNDD